MVLTCLLFQTRYFPPQVLHLIPQFAHLHCRTCSGEACLHGKLGVKVRCRLIRVLRPVVEQFAIGSSVHLTSVLERRQGWSIFPERLQRNVLAVGMATTVDEALVATS